MEEPRKAKPGFLLLGAMLVSASALLFFGWLAEEVLEADTEGFDTFVRAAVHRVASPPITRLMEVSSLLGSAGVLVVLSVLAISVFYYFRRPRAGSLLAITMAGTGALDLVLKHAFHRVRPLAFFGTSPSSYSFPSGHALGSLCFYGALAALLSARIGSRRVRICIWTVAVLIVGMIGFSRVYLGVHYPSDVVAGYCAGIVWVGGVGVVDRILRGRPKTKDGTTGQHLKRCEMESSPSARQKAMKSSGLRVLRIQGGGVFNGFEKVTLIGQLSNP
jgi:membrane-associated phospholipid phosphatase